MAVNMPNTGRGRSSGITTRLGQYLPLGGESRPAVAAVAPLAVWAIAALVALLLPLFLYRAFAGQVEHFDSRIAEAAAGDLAPIVRQREIPRALVAAAAELLDRGELGLNYLTLRNADGVVLLSNGRFEDVGDFLSTAQARQLRGWLYRVSSEDRRLRLRHGGEFVGYMDYGIDLRRVAAALSAGFWLMLLLWFVALLAAITQFGAARGAFVRLREPPPQDPAPAAGTSAGPAPAAVAAGRAAEAGAEEQWQRIAGALGLGVLVADTLGRVRAVNELAGELLERPASMLRGRPVDDLAVFTDDQGQEVASPLQRCLSGDRGPLRDTLTLNGTRVHMAAGRAERSRIYALLWPAAGDGGDRGSAPESFAGTALWSHGDEAAALVDGDGVIRAANPAWCLMMNHGEGELVGTPLGQYIPDLQETKPPAEGSVAGETTIAAAGGLHAAYRLTAILSAGMPIFLATLRPMSGTAAEAAAPPAAGAAPTSGDHDPLTGVPVRAALMKQAHRIWPADELAAAYALLVVDIIDFGQQNRSLGRDAGDQLLAAFAKRLTAIAPEAECVARLGGDEFAVLQRLAGDRDEAEATARRVIEAFSEPVRSGNLELMMRVDVGFAVAPDDADSPETLLQRAEIALSAVQVAGDHRPRRFAPDMADIGSELGPAAQALRRALARSEPELRLWPVWQGDRDAAVAAALVEIAWDGPDGERRVGQDLFAYAESLELAGELAAWCLRTVVEVYASWRNIGLAPVPLVIPLSPAALRSKVLAEAWTAAESRYRVPATAVVLLPHGESASIDLGPRVARDGDADSGDMVRLDPGLLASDPERVRAVVAAARQRGVPVLAGPVEDDDQHVALAEAGIEYWYGADNPLAPRPFGRLIARRGAKPL